MRGRPVAAADGQLWVNTDGDLFRVDMEGGLERISGLPPMGVQSVLADRNGLYWVTSKEGLWSVQFENGLLTDTDDAGVPYPGRAIAEDKDGGMWLGFSCGGLRLLPPQEGAALVDQPSLKTQCVSSLLRDQAGGLWMGTTSGLLHFSEGRWRRIPLPHHLNSLQVWQADDGGLWLGAERHTYRLIRDRQGDYALSAPVTVLEGMNIAKMRAAQRGGIWFVGDQGAFRLVDGKLVEKWTLAEGLSSRFARTIHEDRNGIWIGTYGGGLNLISEGKIHVYDESNGLHDNTVSCVVPDDQGRLWLAGNKGISVIPRPDSHAWIESVPVKVSADAVSFEVNGGTQSACVRDSNGRFWFSLVHGFLTLDPDEYANVEGPVPPIHIARVTSAGGKLDEANGMIELSPRISSVQIEYVGINLTHPDLLSFRYRLSGQSADWAYTKTGRSISYENIPWGEHVFEVQAKNQGGKWSQPARFLISRPAPWYQRQWLWPLVGFCSLMLLVWRTRTTPQNDRHRQRVDRILAESQMRLNRKTGATDKR
jgi:ligand-binding sensor domain-containing protein